MGSLVAVTAALANGRRFVLVNGFGSGSNGFGGHGSVEIDGAASLTGDPDLATSPRSPFPGQGHRIGGMAAAAQTAGAAEALAIAAIQRRHLVTSLGSEACQRIQ